MANAGNSSEALSSHELVDGEKSNERTINIILGRNLRVYMLEILDMRFNASNF